MSGSEGILKVARRSLDLAAAALLMAILSLTFAQVVARYFLSISMPWNEELTRLLFIWLVLFGAARVKHMRIDVLPAALPERAARGLEIASAILGTALLGLLVREAFILIELTAHDRFTALGVSVRYLYMAVIVGGALWILLGLAEALGAPADDNTTPPQA